VPGADMVLTVKARVKSSGTIAMRSVVQMQVQVQRGKQRAASRRSEETAQGRRGRDARRGAECWLRNNNCCVQGPQSASDLGAARALGSSCSGAIVVSSWRLMLALRAHCSAAKHPCAPNLALACRSRTPSPVLTRSARSGAVKLP
jgi:hypothetical protein